MYFDQLFLAYILVAFFLFIFGDIKNAANVYAITWMALIGGLAFPVINISEEISQSTYYILLVLILISYFSFWLGRLNQPRGVPQCFLVKLKLSYMRTARISVLFALALMASNAIYSKGLPLFNLMFGVGPNYLEFGIPTFNGFLIAFINSLAVIFFVIYRRTKNKELLIYILFIFAWHLLVVSRQNLILLIVELIVIIGLEKNMIIQKGRLFLFFFVFLFAFAFLGQIRTGAIDEATGVSSHANDLPSIFVWLLLYTSVNIYSVDSAFRIAPVYDMHSLASLVPSFIRNDFFGVDAISYDRWQEAAVVSYIPDIYTDFGFSGLFLFVFIVFYTTAKIYRKAKLEPFGLSYFLYPTLYFCALMSFFINFWFYLPVIFQLLVYLLIWRFYFKKVPNLYP